MKEPYIIVFDGVCHFCNGAVNFIIRRDPHAQFAFTPMQSDLAKDISHRYQITNVGVDTFLLVKNGRCYIWTDAALEITSDLTGFWYLCLVFKIVPRPIRDFFYKLFARNRYRLFGRRKECMIPSAEIASRFIGGNR